MRQAVARESRRGGGGGVRPPELKREMVRWEDLIEGFSGDFPGSSQDMPASAAWTPQEIDAAVRLIGDIRNEVLPPKPS